MKPSASFREMDSEFLEQRARLWIEGLLDERLPEGEKLSNILSDGEILLRVGKSLDAGGQPVATPSIARVASRKGYMSYSNADTFIKLCREKGVLDIDLFTPPDLVESKDFRRVCLTLRSLAKKARSLNPAVPDFDDATKRPGKGAQGDAGSALKLVDQFEGRGPSKEDAAVDSTEEPSTTSPDLPPQPTTQPATPAILADPTKEPLSELMSDKGVRISPRGRGGGLPNGMQERPLRGPRVAAKQQQLLESVTQHYLPSLVPVPTPEGSFVSVVKEAIEAEHKKTMPVVKEPPAISAEPQPAKTPLPAKAEPKAVKPPPPAKEEPTRAKVAPAAPVPLPKEEASQGSWLQAAKEPPTRDIPVVSESSLKPKATAVADEAGKSARVEDAIPDAKKPKKGPLKWLVVGGAALVLAAVAVIVPKRKKPAEEVEELTVVNGMYSIKKGDTLTQISRRVGKRNWSEIVKLNPEIQNPDLIYPTERIKIH